MQGLGGNCMVKMVQVPIVCLSLHESKLSVRKNSLETGNSYNFDLQQPTFILNVKDLEFFYKNNKNRKNEEIFKFKLRNKELTLEKYNEKEFLIQECLLWALQNKIPFADDKVKETMKGMLNDAAIQMFNL